VSRSTANVSVYAFTVHSRLSIDAFRSLRITGSAVVTTRLSSVAMKTAAEVIANVHIVRCLADIKSSLGSVRSCGPVLAVRIRCPGLWWCG
jgi:hypothetical protein